MDETIGEHEEQRKSCYFASSCEIQLKHSKVILLFRIQLIIEYEYFVFPKTKCRLVFVQLLETKNENENENINAIREQLKQYVNSKKFWKEQFPEEVFRINFKDD